MSALLFISQTRKFEGKMSPANFVMGYPLHFVLYSWSRYFTLFLMYVNIKKILKCKIACWQKLTSHLLTLLGIFAKLKKNRIEPFP